MVSSLVGWSSGGVLGDLDIDSRIPTTSGDFYQTHLIPSLSVSVAAMSIIISPLIIVIIFIPRDGELHGLLKYT